MSETAAPGRRLPVSIRLPDRILGRSVDPRVVAGLLAAVVIGAIVLSTTGFDADRPDIYSLANAFLHGHTGLDRPPGNFDYVPWLGYYYVPFAPFPSLAAMPLMLFISPATAHSLEPLIDSSLAALDVALLWWLAARIGVERIRDRLWLVVLLALGTDLWWVVVRGGVWHTGHLIATALTLAALVECFGRRRALLIGLLAGAAFLTRPPALLGALFYVWVLTRDRDVRSGEGRLAVGRDWALFAAGLAPAFAFFFWYNFVRFGSPLDSGYSQAILPFWLDQLRDQGLFSFSHFGRNFDYFALRLPEPIESFPFFKPSPLGNSILFTSPALLLGLRADWRSAMPWMLAATFVAVMLPNLLYYGGGWYQFGFRYALDAVPFALALCALVLARKRPGRLWWALLAFCVFVNYGGAWWAYHPF